MEAEYTPTLSVDSWTANGNEIAFSVANVGSGVAQDIEVELRCAVGTRNQQELTYLSILTEGVPLTREDIGSGVVEANRIDPVSLTARPSIGLSWRSRGERRLNGALSRSSLRELNGDLSTVLYALSLGKVETLRYEIVLTYDFVRRYTDQEVVYAGTVDVEQDMDLEALLKPSKTDKNAVRDTGCEYGTKRVAPSQRSC